MQSEIWKPIDGCDGLYEVSDMGRVKSYVRSKSGTFLKGWLNNDGYRLLEIKNGISNKRFSSIHSLVAAAFIGPRPDGYQIDHINGCRSDNRSSNLEYVTHSENVRRGKLSNLREDKKCISHGVNYDSRINKWVVAKRVPKSFDGEHHIIYLGSYKTELEAEVISEAFTENIVNRVYVERLKREQMD